ncbi:MAG: PGPGW domain-containing protein [Propionibacteriaceae bacterium]|nr:PGPGW domain-containing protein [Propionibacteriaceae bacterium]
MHAARDPDGADRPDPVEPPRDAPPSDETGEPVDDTVRREHPHLHIPHPHLIDAEEDRWRWRANIRRDPRKLFFYRIGVAVAGLLLMIAAAITGPLPGPGGIPLFLLGLAVWSSEFEWANKRLGWFKRQVARYQGWSRGHRTIFWVVFLACAWTLGYVGMVLYGIPPWMPSAAEGWLARLPGVD